MAPEDPFVELGDHARADEASGRRARRRWLRQQATAEGTLAGALLDLAEGGQPVVVRTDTGREHHGVVSAVGADWCAITPDGGPVTCVALAAIVGVAAPAGAEPLPAPADPRSGDGRRLVEVLGDALAERVSVHVVVRGNQVVAGTLEAVGADVVTVRLPGGATSLVPVAAIGEVTLR